ncbi:RsmE family RNA methyltransferase [Cellulosilyticum sp. I15G10I2]|uniref:RsmE family RNA methyltransferase n=1 Tax=Cellulosilyticum sp. I15G10I2 TaxID=1892843 RepID=UPI00085C735F|nr:RsmE family RNA methyltransferase [Cellulosilyticum sp. I15G10I2]
MAKFFVDHGAIDQDYILITGTDVKHIKNVLRLTEGKEILINDRQGKDYQCIIKKMDTDVIYAKIKHVLLCETEPAVETILFQSLVKGEKMEFVIQKSVEIGVTKIIPICTERCIVKMESDTKIKNKLDRWNKIAESAAKQSKRGIVPEVLKPILFKEAILYARDQYEVSCIPFENEHAHHIKAFLRASNYQSIGVFIGPEGGFTEEEIEFAKCKNILPVTLGKRILRSETAGLVVLANIMYEMGGS